MYIVFRTLSVLLAAVKVAMLVRAILSWVHLDTGRLEGFLFMITEPFVSPIRRVMDRFMSVRIPIDLSFLVTYILLSVLQSILTSVTYSFIV